MACNCRAVSKFCSKKDVRSSQSIDVAPECHIYPGFRTVSAQSILQKQELSANADLGMGGARELNVTVSAVIDDSRACNVARMSGSEIQICVG